MKTLKNIILFFSLGAAVYAIYKKIDTVKREDGYVEECKKQIFARGLEIKDSWYFNLIENNYLEFVFTDFKQKNYKVIFSKIENKITAFTEV
ncbi:MULTISPECIES: hypothetical protein [unclassified Gemella]|uniref:hypothetical protein n=1 Tax=unclassified Gemella TaxID=2624949 RepID=UPI0010733F95|nr:MULTISPECIES: hypothetical protein [unclassified Gemella]MBF0710098.1 hypothetical protein [Gemella sp. GL1.1]MBF0746177.1 hypothetical protein [Gemella sp. 19428wG2_WT2a]NYS27442.1 hypothetical protein [Gemella sp. GL1]TFU60462.1 hypothetical protein E4T67_00560 [Gemella sp. WT2a]